MCYITKRSILVSVILCGFIGTSCAEHTLGNLSLSSPHTWEEAVTDTMCPLVGSTLTGDVTTNTVDTSHIDWSGCSKAWIGAHVERLWLHFEGCFLGYRHDFDTGWDLTSDPVKSCLKHCKNGEFVLTLSKCNCVDQVFISEQHDCRLTNCGDIRHQPFCGFESYCLCRYSVINMAVHGNGNCMTATYSHSIPLYNATGCSSKHSHVCYDPSNPLRSRVSNKQVSWYDAFRDCYKPYRYFQLPGLHHTSLRPYSGTYWINAFAVPFIRWGFDKDMNADLGCLVGIKTNNSRLAVLQTLCNQTIPGICVRFDVTIATTVSTLPTTEKTYPAASTELITTHAGIRAPDVVTTTGAPTTSESHPYDSTTEETLIPTTSTKLTTKPEGIHTPDVVTTTEPPTTSTSHPYGSTTEETNIPPTFTELTTTPEGIHTPDVVTTTELPTTSESHPYDNTIEEGIYTSQSFQSTTENIPSVSSASVSTRDMSTVHGITVAHVSLHRQTTSSHDGSTQHIGSQRPTSSGYTPTPDGPLQRQTTASDCITKSHAIPLTPTVFSEPVITVSVVSVALLITALVVGLVLIRRRGFRCRDERSNERDQIEMTQTDENTNDTLDTPGEGRNALGVPGKNVYDSVWSI